MPIPLFFTVLDIVIPRTSFSTTVIGTSLIFASIFVIPERFLIFEKSAPFAKNHNEREFHII